MWGINYIFYIFLLFLDLFFTMPCSEIFTLFFLSKLQEVVHVYPWADLSFTLCVFVCVAVCISFSVSSSDPALPFPPTLFNEGQMAALLQHLLHSSISPQRSGEKSDGIMTETVANAAWRPSPRSFPPLRQRRGVAWSDSEMTRVFGSNMTNPCQWEQMGEGNPSIWMSPLPLFIICNFIQVVRERHTSSLQADREGPEWVKSKLI